MRCCRCRWSTGPTEAQTNIFPPFKARPIPSLRNKKVGLLLSGGSGACVAACGVARALEEAGIEPQAISVCSGSALWGSMMAAGLTAQEMVDQSLNWQPEDYLDIQWTRMPRFALAAMRGFTGLAKGEAIEKLFDRQLWHMTLGETPVRIYSEVYNIDLNRLEIVRLQARRPTSRSRSWCESRSRCRCWSSRCASRATCTPTAAWWTCSRPSRCWSTRSSTSSSASTRSCRAGSRERTSRAGPERTMGFMTASRQISYAGHLELARRSARRLGRKLILIDPVDYTEVHGWRFYDLFIDRRKWPRLIMQGYEHATTRARPLPPLERRPQAPQPAAAP